MRQPAQINVARMRGAPDSPVMAGFMAAVDPVYRMAEDSPGFVWRLRGAGGHMPTCRDEERHWQVVNVSVCGGCLTINGPSWTTPGPG